MNNEFIKIRKTVYEYKRYIREVEFLKYDIKKRLLDIMDNEFIKVEEFEENYNSLFIKFYNEKLDLNFEVQCFKKTNELFV